MIKWWDRMVDGLVTMWPKESDMLSSQSVSSYWFVGDEEEKLIFYKGDSSHILEDLLDEHSATLDYLLEEINYHTEWVQAIADGKVRLEKLGE